jgi:RNA polymerase sigma-70 factor (ECF subfamily)
LGTREFAPHNIRAVDSCPQNQTRQPPEPALAFRDVMNEEGNQPAESEADGDRSLADRARHGDHAAFDELVRRYHGKLYGLIYNMTSNKEDTEDMLQDVFTKAYQSLPAFRGHSSFYTWIYRIAINRTINFLKRRRRKQTLSLDDIDIGVERDPAYVQLSARESPVRDVNISELQEKLNKALLTLSEKHRTVVVLHDVQGIPHHDIAKMLKVSEGTVRSRLFYARQHLQNELAEFTR